MVQQGPICVKNMLHSVLISVQTSKQNQNETGTQNESNPGPKTRLRNGAHFCQRFQSGTINFITKTGPEMRGHFFANASPKKNRRAPKMATAVHAHPKSYKHPTQRGGRTLTSRYRSNPKGRTAYVCAAMIHRKQALNGCTFTDLC